MKSYALGKDQFPRMLNEKYEFDVQVVRDLRPYLLAIFIVRAGTCFLVHKEERADNWTLYCTMYQLEAALPDVL